MAFAKRFPFNAAGRLEFRAEVFNLLNTTNFGTPAGNISSSNAGVITTADDPAERAAEPARGLVGAPVAGQ